MFGSDQLRNNQGNILISEALVSKREYNEDEINNLYLSDIS